MRIHKKNLRGLNRNVQMNKYNASFKRFNKFYKSKYKNKNFKKYIKYNLYLISTKNNSRLILKKRYLNQKTKKYEYNIVLSKTSKQMKCNTSVENAFELGTIFANLIPKYTKRIQNLIFKGFNTQKSHVLRGFKLALHSHYNKIKIKKIIEATSLPHNGCRPKKLRRLKHLRS